MNKIVVIGSANADHVMTFDYLPAAGQTLMSRTYRLEQGGKGANQAVACARLAQTGTQIDFICHLGDDSIGKAMRQRFIDDGIQAAGIRQIQDVATGTAMIFIGGRGENTIGVTAGANNSLTPQALDTHSDLMTKANYLLIQLETPAATVRKALQLAKRNGTTTILNPAPASCASQEFLQWVDIITPNETEAEAITGIEITNEDNAQLAAQFLHQAGVKTVVITLGQQGAYISSDEFCGIVEAINVQAIDTVAAGDTFNGALVVGLSEGMGIKAATQFANAAAAMTVTREGAQRAIPYRSELQI